MDWAELSWEEIPNVLKAVNGAALLPIGATEQHGPHLACGVDTVVAQTVCDAVSTRTHVPVLPAMPYGCSLGHSSKWPGTISLDPVMLIQLVKQIGDWAYKSGVRRLFLVNGHVTNEAPLRCALEMLRAQYSDLMVNLTCTGKMSPRVDQFHHADAIDWHANDAETSLMMAVAPEQIRSHDFVRADDPDRTQDLVFAHPVNHTSLNGVTGFPSQASLDKGKQGFAWMVEDLTAIVEHGINECAPLTS
ncbi:creatininase family protein [Vibrio sp. CAIM 722]|uniref:Creatininase family protein n=1 Tax=Vibrio eleionomae TaxID=2653505 RepID=A0A7X4LKF2_9VIBR|nr:creatininase family protein [Vibrio eleionomae]MZI93615.1 creatininase family protein [Vibrio eleionomae]